ncbi:hypothetical protein K5E_09770 [Enterococcus thailandicus]|uniref:Uncharacterized protein n=1 Tax=Enterococcus thailandicus TaxID=417368 RepID=A0A249SGU6_ENTTH|nr:hypothetical protein CK496_02320 [Enterococcus thailandicus]GEK35959.1 hypothetical protein ETH01_02460 [Enterococcus thailandicus]GMC02975.1 hypothetical protein K4E_04890 [Enterococcus thailandicus]GMC08838.1 hypothetical protein K5E_09770 [Enterococcus thailandicus]
MIISMESKRNTKARLKRLQYLFVILMIVALIREVYFLAFSFGITSSIFYLFQKNYKENNT